MNSNSIYNDKEISIVRTKVNRKFNKQQDQICCALCGKNIKGNGKSFHKSHTVPFFCLENIKASYKNNYGVLQGNYVCLRTAFSEDEFIGTNKAGVFYSICSDCDNKEFKVYESEDALLNTPPEDLVDAIALKTYLNELFKTYFRNYKNSIKYKELTDDQLISSFFESIGKVEKPAVKLDIKDFQDNLEFAKTSFKKGYRNYRVIYHTILDYTVPIAAQVAIPISKNVDFSNLQVVNMYNKKRLEDLLVCIFPLKEKSVILLFTRIDNRLMKKYSKKFKKLSDKNKLKEVFYLLIRYKAINYFFSPLLKDILKDKNILEISGIEDTIIKTDLITVNMADFENHKCKDNLPSLLSEEYSMQNLLRKKT